MAASGTAHKWKKRGRKALVFLVVICAVLAAGFFLGRRLGTQEKEPVITGELLGQKLTTIRELAVVEYHYTNMGKFENQVDFYGWEVPFTTKRFILSYNGIIKAGVDLEKAEIKVDDSSHTVTIVLPKSGILSHEILEDSIEVFDETKNIFNQITIEDYTGFTMEQKQVIEQKAIGEGLLTSASEKARAAVESLFSLLPGMEEYELVVK